MTISAKTILSGRTMISGGFEPRAWRLIVVEYVADRSGSGQLSPIRVR